MEIRIYNQEMNLGDTGTHNMWKVSINGKDKPCLFYEEHQAYIYAGLLRSGLSLNDSSYLSNYINVMIDGLSKGE